MSAHPTPKPGPRTPRPAATLPTNNPAQWGRIDDAGVVYVRTDDGERVIGEWKAGTPDEGLAHFGKRYDDLATEVVLLARRVATHPVAARKAAEELAATLPTAAVLGDIKALETQLNNIVEQSYAAEKEAQQQRAARRQAAIARKTEIVEEAQKLAATDSDWKASGDRLNALFEEWKTIKGADRSHDDALWRKFSAARDEFQRRRGSHFAELDRARAKARRIKEELIEKAEALSTSTNWGETAAQYRELMDEWKKAGRAPREVDDRLWERFRAARDTFFDARTADHEARDAEFAANAAAKEALLAEYGPQINPEENLQAAKKALHELQDKWEEIGFVPRGRVREFEDKIRALEKSVAAAEDAQWRKTDPEVAARAAQFSAKAQELTQAAQDAESKGNHKKAEDLFAQAEQWKQWAATAEGALA